MNNAKKQDGFSLIELVIAIFLIGLVVIVIGNIPNSIRLIGNSQSESRVREIAAKRVEDIRLAGYDGLANGTTAIIDSRLSQLQNVSGSTVISDCPFEVCGSTSEIKQVRITISWTENSEPKTYQIVTLVAKDGLK